MTEEQITAHEARRVPDDTAGGSGNESNVLHGLKILRGLKEAIAYARGDTSAARVIIVQVRGKRRATPPDNPRPE